MAKDSALVLKSPLEMVVENIKTTAARMFNRESEPSGDEIVVELEAAEDNTVKNIINISNLKRINTFTKEFVEELQLQSEEKETALKDYIQNIIEQYFVVKEPEIQQYLEQKFENVVNQITNVDRTTVEYQKDVERIIERVLQNAEANTIFEQEVIEKIEQVAPEIVQREMQQIINKAQTNNYLTVKNERNIQNTVNELQKTYLTQTERVENNYQTVNPQTVEIVKETKKDKLSTVNQQLVGEIPASSIGGGAPLSESVSTLPPLDISDTSSSFIPSAPSNAGSGRPARPVVTVQAPEAHTEFYGYPGFLGISELA